MWFPHPCQQIPFGQSIVYPVRRRAKFRRVDIKNPGRLHPGATAGDRCPTGCSKLRAELQSDEPGGAGDQNTHTASQVNPASFATLLPVLTI